MGLKYKKVSNNENAIEIDGKVVLPFDLRYKEYLKWKAENPDLEQQLVNNFGQEIENKKLYNRGEPHKKGNICKWYDEDGHLIIKSEMKDDKPHGIQWNYYKNGNVSAQVVYKDGKKDGELETWHENGKRKSKIFFSKL